MQLHSMVIDDFLADFQAVRKWADEAAYADITNPIDGVTYPGICADIPEHLRNEIHFKLQMVLGGAVNIKMLFARLSAEGVPVPHQAHNDASHGMFSLMIYLNRDVHCAGGTELVRHHWHDMHYGPVGEYELGVWKEDANEPDMWEAVSLCEMCPNRAFIFDARLMHRAAPIGGFGKDATDGRLVLTAFFDTPQC